MALRPVYDRADKFLPIDSITGPESDVIVPPEAKLLDYEVSQLKQ